MVDSRDRLWRTLIRVETIDANCVEIIVPAWGKMDPMSLDRSSLPTLIYDRMLRGHIYFVSQVNIGADRPEDFRFEDWEVS